MAYSKDIRIKALEHCQNGESNAEVSQKLKISPQTLSNWKRQLFTTGSLDKKKPNREYGKPYKYKPDKIKELMDKNRTSEPVKATGSNDNVGSKTVTMQNKSKKKKLVNSIYD